MAVLNGKRADPKTGLFLAHFLFLTNSKQRVTAILLPFEAFTSAAMQIGLFLGNKPQQLASETSECVANA